MQGKQIGHYEPSDSNGKVTHHVPSGQWRHGRLFILDDTLNIEDMVKSFDINSPRSDDLNGSIVVNENVSSKQD